MKKLFFFLSLLTLFACVPKRTKSSVGFEHMSTADSLEVVCALREHFWEEMLAFYDKEYRPFYEYGYISCGERNNVLTIEMNKKKKIRFQLDFFTPIDTISESTFTWLITNLEENKNNNYPYYYRTSLREINSNIHELTGEIERFHVEMFPEEQIDFKRNQIKEWKNKKRIMTVLKTKIISEIDPIFLVKIEYTENLKSSEILMNPVFEAFLKLRNYSSEKYFKEPYINIFIRNYLKKNKRDTDKLEAIELLHPLRILDIPFIKKNGFRTPFDEVIAPPPIQVE